MICLQIPGSLNSLYGASWVDINFQWSLHDFDSVLTIVIEKQFYPCILGVWDDISSEKLHTLIMPLKY